MTLQEILRAKGSKVFTIRPDATLDDVVQELVRHNCGSLVVCENAGCQEVLGIITERDILRITAARRGPLEKLFVRDHMTRNLVTGSIHDSIEQIMEVMTTRRVRHLPILDDAGDLHGLISIGDVVKSQLNSVSMENHYLKTYINGDMDNAHSMSVPAIN